MRRRKVINFNTPPLSEKKAGALPRRRVSPPAEVKYNYSTPDVPSAECGWKLIPTPVNRPAVPQAEECSTFETKEVYDILYSYFGLLAEDQTLPYNEQSVRARVALQSNVRLTIRNTDGPERSSDLFSRLHTFTEKSLWNLCFHLTLSENIWPDTNTLAFEKRVTELYSRLSLVDDRSLRISITAEVENNALYFTESSAQTLELTCQLFHTPTLEFMEHQELQHHMNPRISASYRQFREFLQCIHSNFLPIERECFMLYSGFCLFVRGLRGVRDLDLWVAETHRHNFLPRVYHWFHPLGGKLRDVDIIMEHNAREIYTKWLNHRPELLSCESANKLILNSNNYIFFKGVKVLGPKASLAERLTRAELLGGLGAFVDLVKLFEQPDIKFELPPIPKLRIFQRKRTMATESLTPAKVFRAIKSIMNAKYKENREIEEIAALWNTSYEDKGERKQEEFKHTAF